MVPNGWSHKLFKQVLKLDRGSSPRPIVNFITESNEGVNWIKIGDTKGDDSFINQTKEKITPEGAKKSRKVSKGEIILSNSMSYGKPYILNIDGYIHDGWFVIREYESHLDKQFLIQVLGSESVQKQYKRLAAGGVVTNISSELVYAVKINFPTIQEQRKIAKILSTWDKAISTTERLIDNSKQQKKALMQQLLTGKKRLLDDSGKQFGGEWEEIEVGQLTKIFDGTHSTPKYVMKGIPFYSVEHLTRNDFSITKFISEEVFEKENKRVKLERNDILMTRIGDIGTAKCLTWDVQASFYVSLALFKSNERFDSKYLTYYINSKEFHRELWKRTIHVAFPKKINLGEIGHCLVKLPSHKEQRRIAAVLTNADKEIELLEQQLDDLKQEKKAMMQQLLTGKRRVKS